MPHAPPPQHIAVVGAGIIGLLCAHHLKKRGAEVTVIDRATVGAGCSAGNAGWVTPSISNPLPAPGLTSQSLRWMLRADSPLYIRPTAVPGMLPWLFGFWKHCNRRDFERGTHAMAALNELTMELFDELHADGIDYESRSTGLLMVFENRHQLEEETAVLELIDYRPVEPLDADQLRRREPALTEAPSQAVFGGLHVLPERTIRPETVCRGTAASLADRGVEIVENCEVTGWLGDGGKTRALVTSSGPIEADAFLLATGAEAASLSAQLNIQLPLQAGKGYSSTVSNSPVTLLHSLYLSGAKVGISPFAGGIRVAGTMELSGINLRLDERRFAALERGAAQVLPRLFERGSGAPWVGMRPLTPDGLPILGRLPDTGNVYVATGHQMLGVTLAPSTGRVMSELILEGRSSVDLGPFDPRRFD